MQGEVKKGGIEGGFMKGGKRKWEMKKGLERRFTKMGKFEKEEIFVLNFQ